MKHNFSPKTRIELDFLGQFYASIINSEQPGVFSISAYLKTSINPAVLQQAVNDLMKRLPFLNGRLRDGFFWYEHEVLEKPPEIVPIKKSSPSFSDYYNSGEGHVIRVLYGESHFTVEAIHSICDGRGLSKIVSALLVRYFELLGEEIDKANIIDCLGTLHLEEVEDAFLRYANLAPKFHSKKKKESLNIKAYRPVYSKHAKQQVITQKYDTKRLKKVAKDHNLSITGYILACIFKAIAEKRPANESKKPITASMPIDCRSYLPSKTLRSFVSNTTIIMPETTNLIEMSKGIKSQLEAIDKDFIHQDIKEKQRLYNKTRYIPRAFKKLLMKWMERSEANGNTTGLSNLGVVKLPEEIENLVDRLEFAISLEQETPYYFSCVTMGDTLTLTATFKDVGYDVIKTVMDSL